MLTGKQTKNGQTNRRNYTNFERNLAMMVIYLPTRSVFELESGNKNVDGQTDVGHINLIARLVTRLKIASKMPVPHSLGK